MNSRELNAKNEPGTNSRDFMVGAIIGGLAGAAAALLLAPKSGKELRTTLNQQTSSILEKTDQMKNSAMTKSNDIASAAKEKASSIAQTVSQQSNSLLNKVRENKGQGESQLPEGGLEEVPTSLAETSTMEQTHTATGEEIQRKLEETQRAFDETENKLNQ